MRPAKAEASETPASTARTQPAAQSAAASPAPPPRISPSWNAAVAAWLHRHKSYPAAARSRGEQGRTAVRFTVARDGNVTEIQIVRSSGSALLDDAVRSMLTGAHLPPFPADMAHAQITVTVQINYSLER